MYRYIFLCFGLSLALAACNSNSTQTSNTANTTPSDSSIQNTQQSCFQYIKDKDTARITMMSSGVITTGELSYNLYEKDKNNGVFEGELHGDTLIAEYTFNSEGRESIRQVGFLKKGDQLIEGYGDQEEKNGKMMFKNTSKLSFSNSIVFNKTACY